MRKIQQIGLLALVFLVTMSCTKLPLYHSNGIEDKNAAILRYYDSKGKILYDIYYDDKNIIVHTKTSDFMAQLKIIRRGFTLWLDQKGKKNRKMGIVFPQEQMGNSKLSQPEGRSTGQNNAIPNKWKQQLEQLKEQYRLSPKNMTLIGFSGDNSQTAINTELEESDIHVSILFDIDDVLHYKAIIPIKKIFNDDKYKDSIFSIGFESGYFDNEFNDPPKQEGMGRGGNMGMGRPGGNKAGGRGRPATNGSRDEQRSAMSEAIKVWFRVKLNNQSQVSLGYDYLPTRGAIISKLPIGSVNVTPGSNYYYWNGIFYIPTSVSSYKIVGPTKGIRVSTLLYYLFFRPKKSFLR